MQQLRRPCGAVAAGVGATWIYLLRLLVASNKALPSREVIAYFLEQCHRQVVSVETVLEMKQFFQVMRDRGFPLDTEMRESFKKLKIGILGEDSDEEAPAPAEATKMLLVDGQSVDFRVADFGARAAEIRGSRAVLHGIVSLGVISGQFE